MDEDDLRQAQHFGVWTEALKTDTTGRRVLCRCQCGAMAQLSLAALREGGAARLCGCVRSKPPRIDPSHSFAAGIGDVERRVAGGRHRGRR